MAALSRFRGRRRQQGAAAIEFALIFILFFALFYAIIAYSLAMLMMQGLTQAAEEGVRAAIAVNPLAYPTEAAYQGAVEATAQGRAAAALSWLPTQAHDRVVGGGNIVADLTGNLVTVTVTYPDYAGNGLVPTLTLPFIGDVPRVPADLVGAASLQI
jgi:Flp pilus assembly protein TadG